MPPIDITGRAMPQRRAKVVKAKRKAPTYSAPRMTPDTADRLRSPEQKARDAKAVKKSIRDSRARAKAVHLSPKRQRSMTPDTLDRYRSPAQKAKDAAGVAKAIRDSRQRAQDRKTHVIAGPRGMSVEHYAGRSTGEILADLARPEPRTHTMLVAGPRGQTRPTRQSSFTGGELLATALLNTPKDLGELAVTTPSSLAHLAVTAATHPEKLPKELIDPYLKLIKDPAGEFTKHPVSTALMVAPFVKAPARAAGRAAAATGRSSLARTPATLEGTSLQAQRWRSPDPIERGTAKVRVPKARRPKGPEITEKEIDRRVDEAYDAGQLHKQAAVSSAAKQANRRFGDLPKAGRDAAIESHLSGARGGAAQEATRRFAREFGSHWYIDAKTGALVKPKRPAEGSGVLHESKADAERVAERVPFEAKVITVESPSGTRYAVVPARAAERWGHHGRVGVSPETEAVILRTGTRQFRKTVLPLSTKWLGGQVVEAALRNAVMGAGPTSYLRAKRILNELPEAERRELINRTTQGGQFGATGPAKEFARGEPITLAEEFAPTGLAAPAAKLTKAGAAPGVRHLRQGYRRYSEIVFNDINGTVERLAKTAQLGKAIKQSPLMERSMLGLSHKAVEEAAAGLRGTSTQVELGRALDRAYGKYSKFGPHARRTLLHTSPFFPWFRNMAEFLFRVMPQDHPVLTALAADVSLAEEEWRKAHRLSLHGKDHVKPFMMGSYPKGEKFVPLARFGPFMPADAVGELGGQLYPAFRGMLEAASGRDWTGRELEGFAGTQAGRVANAVLTGAETFLPGVSQLDRVTGLGPRYVRGQGKKESVVQGKDLSQAIVDLLNPVKPIGTSERKKKKKADTSLGFGGGGGSGSGGGGTLGFR